MCNILLLYLYIFTFTSGGDYSESVVLEYSTKPTPSCWIHGSGLVWQEIQEPLTQDNYHKLKSAF